MIADVCWTYPGRACTRDRDTVLDFFVLVHGKENEGATEQTCL